MTTKHTPEIYTHQVMGGKTEGVALGDNGWARIEGGTFEQRHARARLIAAAPDMAEALLKALDALMHHAEYVCGPLRAALVKAGVLE